MDTRAPCLEDPLNPLWTRSLDPLFWPASRAGVESAWITHVPFAHWLVTVHRPRSIVELGTHSGVSYAAFCEAVQRNAIECRCLAVDTWQGDEHAGFYGGEVYDELRRFHDSRYAGFSDLLRCTFDAALDYVPDNSIDLLHIDGLHTYDAVRRDFEQWKPKLSDRAVVLLHDTNVRERDFGVWRLWRELSSQYPSFEFLHGHGLGVLAVGPSCSAEVFGLSRLPDAATNAVRERFSFLGERWRADMQAHLDKAEVDEKVRHIEGLLHERGVHVESLKAKIERLNGERAWMDAEAADLAMRAASRRADVEAEADALAIAENKMVTAQQERDQAQQALANAERRARDLETGLSNAHRKIDEISGHFDAVNTTLTTILRSTAWRVTWPARQFGSGLPHSLRRTIRGAAHIVWWTFTFQLLQKLRDRRAILSSTNRAVVAVPENVELVRLEDGDPYERIARQIFAEQQAEVNRAKTIVTIGEFARTPLISVIMPVYKTPVQWLRRAVESLQEQYYEHWELCAVDDCSPTNEQRELLKDMAAKDARIRLKVMETNSGISTSSNAGLAMAHGEFVALLDHDDELTKDAFYWIVSEINAQPDADFIYTDECKIDDTSERRLFHFVFKPDWSPEIMFNGMLTGHLTAYKTGVVRRIGGFRSKYDFSQDYDLALRMSETVRKIVHIERVLYLWRSIPGSAAGGGKDFARESNIGALNDALARRSIPGIATALPHVNCVRMTLPDEIPLVSIVIPSDSRQNLRTALNALRDKTEYPNFEVIVVCNGPLAERLKDEYDDVSQFVFLHYNKKYNFSDKCNEGARAANGEFVIFYNDDVLPAQRDWIERLIELLYVPGVEGVSPKLLFENNTIQYAGMISGTPGLVGTPYNNMSTDYVDSFLSMHRWVRNVSVLSGACCALRTDVFWAVGGFDSVNTPDGHSDMDLSYKLIRAGYRCAYTPHSVLYHVGNASWNAKHGKYKADIFMLKRWGAYVSRDPNFTESMKRALYHDFQFVFRIFAAHVDPGARYDGPDVLFVSHELSLSGAPRMLLYAAMTVRERGGFPVVVAPIDGPIRAELEAAGIVVIVDASVRDGHFLFERFARNFDLVVVNTLDLLHVVRQLSAIDGLDVVWWLHEAKQLANAIAVDRCTQWSRVRFFCNSEYSRRYLPAQCCAEVLQYGIPDKRDEVNLSSRQERMTFILAGTLEPRKGQDIFVEAIALLPERVRKDCQFLITGKLWEVNRLYWVSVQAAMAGMPEVKYLGLLDHRDMLGLIARSDVLVCCSRDEPFSLVVMEAAMLGKPSILSTNVGAGEVFRPASACMIFESGNVAALAEKILVAFESADVMAKMGETARAVFEQELTLEAFSDRFCLKVLQDLSVGESLLS